MTKLIKVGIDEWPGYIDVKQLISIVFGPKHVEVDEINTQLKYTLTYALPHEASVIVCHDTREEALAELNRVVEAANQLSSNSTRLEPSLDELEVQRRNAQLET